MKHTQRFSSSEDSSNLLHKQNYFDTSSISNAKYNIGPHFTLDMQVLRALFALQNLIGTTKHCDTFSRKQSSDINNSQYFHNSEAKNQEIPFRLHIVSTFLSPVLHNKQFAKTSFSGSHSLDKLLIKMAVMVVLRGYVEI